MGTKCFRVGTALLRSVPPLTLPTSAVPTSLPDSKVKFIPPRSQFSLTLLASEKVRARNQCPGEAVLERTAAHRTSEMSHRAGNTPYVLPPGPLSLPLTCFFLPVSLGISTSFSPLSVSLSLSVHVEMAFALTASLCPLSVTCLRCFSTVYEQGLGHRSGFVVATQ